MDENGPFMDDLPNLKMVVFHSYVGLPDIPKTRSSFASWKSYGKSSFRAEAPFCHGTLDKKTLARP